MPFREIHRRAGCTRKKSVVFHKRYFAEKIVRGRNVYHISLSLAGIALWLLCQVGIVSAEQDSAAVSPLPSEEFDRVAVVTFIARGVDPEDAKGMSDFFRQHLQRKCVFTVMDPEEMDDALKDNAFPARYRCDHNSCYAEMGRYLGVRYIIVGSVGKVKNIYTLVVRMVDAYSGEVKKFILKDYQLPIREILEKALPELAKEFNDQLIKLTYATADVVSTPPGASVFMDDKYCGVTPLLLRRKENGRSCIRLRMEKYDQEYDTLMMLRGETVSVKRVLTPTGHFRAELMRKQKNINIRILQGSGIITGLVAYVIGGYYEIKCVRSIDEQRKITEDFMNGDSELTGSAYRDLSRKIDQRRKYRNIGVLTGTILLTGVSVTLFF